MADNNLFAEFPIVSREEWLAQVTKDLKDKPLESLDWQLADGLTLSPLVHAGDLHPGRPMWEAPKSWQICESVDATDLAAANAQALEALEGGAEAVEFYFQREPGFQDVQTLLSGIYLDFAGLYFNGAGVLQNPAATLGHLARVCAGANVDPKTLRGGVAYSPAQTPGVRPDWRYLADLAAFAGETFPGFRVITVAFSEATDPVDALTETLTTANDYLEKLSEKGVPVRDITALMDVTVPVGADYFMEMARLRALKLLWLHLLKGWNAPLEYPFVSAAFKPSAYTGELYTNMIRSTTMAMSAVMGGADRLTVLPYDADRENEARYPAAFGRRIARNVQHLLKMESALEDSGDPAAGSYFLEKLTQTLAGKAWKRFSGPK